MNNETLCRITQDTSQNNRLQFRIPLSEFGCDEKARYVERVCAILIESRFGFAPVDLLVIDISDQRESGTTVFCDLRKGEPDEIVVCYFLSRQGRAGSQSFEAACGRTTPTELATSGVLEGDPTANSSLNQGRGSP
jgi:hypothetical protein